MTRAQLLRRGLVVGGLLAFGELPESLTELTEPPAAVATGHWVEHASGYTDLVWFDSRGFEMGWQLQNASEDARRDAERKILDRGGAYQYGGLAL